MLNVDFTIEFFSLVSDNLRRDKDLLMLAPS